MLNKVIVAASGEAVVTVTVALIRSVEITGAERTPKVPDVESYLTLGAVEKTTPGVRILNVKVEAAARNPADGSTSVRLAADWLVSPGNTVKLVAEL
jgi:hypothetical protein